MAIKRLVLATDFSASSREALEYAIQFALALGAELYLLHVFERPFFVEPGVSHSVQLRHGVDQWIRELKVEESRKLDALAGELRGRGVTVHPLVKEGIPFVEILKTAEEIPADLVVLGTHGRTGLAHVVIGSVAQRVVQKARCPVLTVRPAAFGGAKTGSSGPG
ncbi:MAG: universal stress protein [Nitrospirae bacterium]|nr:universal stress protein [Nitrospirota bacterium]